MTRRIDEDVKKLEDAPFGEPSRTEYYEDVARDRRNLTVTTLHRPGRPHYSVRAKTLGAAPAHRRRTKRYWRAALAGPADADELARWETALELQPRDEDLWLRYIDYRARIGTAAALQAAERALLACGDRRKLRSRRLDAAADHMPAHEFREMLRAALRDDDGRDRRELWIRAVGATLRSGEPEEVRDVAAEAARHIGASAVFAFGAYLRSAGRWETLVLLVELLAAAHFPMAETSEEPAEAERTLAEFEERVRSAGLPTGPAWARVERARAAVRWRPGAACDADPERAPPAADVAEVVRGAMQWRGGLAAAALLLAKVPLLPGTEAGLYALHGRAACLLEWAEPVDVAVLPLLWARAESKAAWEEESANWVRELVRPPHYVGEAPGFLAWIERLWEAAVSAATQAEERDALLCWRLRWAALARMLGVPEARRGARAAARGGSALVLADLAALETGARREMTLRAAWDAAPVSSPAALYAARRLGRDALASAVLGLSPKDASSDTERIRAAYKECCRRCDQIEREVLEAQELLRDHHHDHEHDHAAGLWAALLPHEGEWARARALLCAGRARLDALCAQAGALMVRSARALRWREACAEAVVCAGGDGSGARARALLPLHPRNATLSYYAGCAPAWCGGPRSGGSGVGALGTLLHAPWCPRVARRASQAAPHSAAVWGARVLAERRAGSVRATLPSAIAAAPHDKWLLLEAAAAGEDVDALAERALCRGLRLYALPLELQPLQSS